MKKLAAIIVMGILSFISASAVSAQEKTEQPFKSYSVEQFEQLIASEDVVRLDVRAADEYAEGHIEGTLNIDVLQPTFKKIAGETLPKDKTIALYCRTGKRSKTAAGMLAKMGYDVVELSTGYTGWVEAEKPVVK